MRLWFNIFNSIYKLFRMEPASAEKLLRAFQILDADGKGTLSREYITKLMSDEGEPFTQASEKICYTIKWMMLYQSKSLVMNDEWFWNLMTKEILDRSFLHLGRNRRDDGSRCWCSFRRHPLWILYQFAYGKCIYLFL